MSDTYSNTSNKYFHAFFKNAAIGIVIVNQAGTITALNGAACQLMGYEEPELLLSPIEKILPASFSLNKPIQQSLHSFPSGRLRHLQPAIELIAVKKDGTKLAVEVNLAYAHMSSEDLVMAFIHPLDARRLKARKLEKEHAELEEKMDRRNRDLKKTLEQLKVANEKLQESLSFQNAILTNAGVMIISVDEEGYIQTLNPEAERELGYTLEELKGSRKALIFHDPQEIKQRALSLSRELEVNIPPGMEVFFVRSRLGLHNECEWSYIRKDGTRFPVLLNITALKDEAGVPAGFLGIAINISERKLYEYNLNKSLEREKELNELKSKFVSMASHEFRTPLSTILSSVYLIEKYPATDQQPQRLKHIHRIVSAVSSLSDILNDFLSVGKIEEGKMQASLKIFNLYKMIQDLIEDFTDQLKAGQKIPYHATGHHFVELDPFLLRHILTNLLSNAIKFSPENRPIHITSECSEKGIVLTVTDQGIGISKEDQKHLMERFFRASNATNIQGTGLGLHIVSKYVELLNGRIFFRSDLDAGTCIKVSFTSKTFPNENNPVD